MTAETILAMFERAGGYVGETCRSIPAGMTFQECCGSRTTDYNCHEFIARGPRGGVYYLSHDLDPDCEGRTFATFGQEGFHHRNGTTPCV